MEKLYDTKTLVQTHYADQEFLKQMIMLFVKHIPESNTALKEASAAGDWANVYFYSHKMKASIDLFSILTLKTLIREIEQSAKNQHELEAIPGKVEYVSGVIEQCIAAMKEEYQLEEQQ